MARKEKPVWPTGQGFWLEGDSPEEVAKQAGSLVRDVRVHARMNMVWVALAVLIIAGGAGYLVGQGGGESATLEAEQRPGARESLFADALREKDDAIRACRQVVHDATRVIRARTLYIGEMYDRAFDDASDAYSLGAEGNEEAFLGGLLRSLNDRSLLEDLTASETRASGWTGWADQEALASCRGAALGSR